MYKWPLQRRNDENVWRRMRLCLGKGINFSLFLIIFIYTLPLPRPFSWFSRNLAFWKESLRQHVFEQFLWNRKKRWMRVNDVNVEMVGDIKLCQGPAWWVYYVTDECCWLYEGNTTTFRMVNEVIATLKYKLKFFYISLPTNFELKKYCFCFWCWIENSYETWNSFRVIFY